MLATAIGTFLGVVFVVGAIVGTCYAIDWWEKRP